MKKLLNITLCFSVSLMGCAGRKPNPIESHMPGDTKLTCQAIYVETRQIERKMDRLEPKINKFATNTLWGIAGVFLIFPFFFMDVKDAEKIEYQAYQERLDRLEVLAIERKCGTIDE